MSGLNDSSPAASSALLAAALGGLLCLTACSSDEAAVDGTPTRTDGAALGAYYECPGGAVADPPVITSTKTVADLTSEAFQADCNKRHGVFEIEPHCGGSNGCRGVSYDNGTDAYTEHSCRGANTCGGFSCIVCD